jgi:hypothetical protein
MSTDRNKVIDECLDILRALPSGTWGDVSGERSPWPVAIKAIEALKITPREQSRESSGEHCCD